MSGGQAQDDCRCDRRAVPHLYRIRATIFCIGVILLIFGIALFLTFYAEENRKDFTKLENDLIKTTSPFNSCDKFSAAMRLAGILLMAAALFTISISIALVVICSKSKKLLCYCTAVSTDSDISPHTSDTTPQFRSFFTKLRHNWQRQNCVMTAEELQLRIDRMTSQRDQPPEYITLPGIGATSIDPPPPYPE